MALPPLDPEERIIICELGVLEAVRSGTTALLEDWTSIEGYADARCKVEAPAIRVVRPGHFVASHLR